MTRLNYRNPLSVIESLVRERNLIYQFVKREVAGRYKGSFLGIFWSFVNPLLLLSVYTFVFGVIFKSKWRPASTSHFEFAVVMFVGVLTHGLLAECINRAPGMIVANTNYVKRVVFPLETLTWITLGTALFHTFIASLILIGGIFFWQQHLPITAWFVPLILVPYLLMIAGVTWFLMSLGVFLRDIGQLMSIVTSLLMFLSPVFYPTTSVPEDLRFLIEWNPLTFIIEQLRDALIWGHAPDWIGLLKYFVFGYIAAWLGFAFFQRTRRGFADVL
ncbi:MULTISPECIES: ABC transporter permease [unclassified Caballeronia]|uniref:ABC transporter permease n=1 Tax=unclassified Caballeronia TaxID=2646786 RepID=UPI002858927C|nr:MULTISPECIES: ABC transporter permease [unclassified Caballeronia]MDR5751451.1 ABC transporter permease [Caballeronia sp. LZ024]MDR5844408.1 ABC transporter permease [Caballeronia sp. LZ031]